MKKALLLALLFCAQISLAQEEIKTMFYNLLEYPNALPENRDELLRSLIDEYDPDIFMVCELQSAAGANLILSSSLNFTEVEYAKATFIDNTSGSSDLQQLIYYKTSKFSLISSEIIPTTVRDINRYVLRLNTVDQDTNPVDLDIYVTHLKSSQGSSNVTTRFNMVKEFTDTFPDLDPNSYVIFAGDLNLYTGTEPAYVELTASTNEIVLKDPINRNGSWHVNSSFQDIHTQSTRTSSAPFGGAGAGGGMDDRFDFILISENMLTNPQMKYVSGTYMAYGNNGNCFNKSINDSDCNGDDFDSEIRNILYNISDHLPVVMSFETNEEFLNGTDFVALDAISFPSGNMVTNMLQVQINNGMSFNADFEIYNIIGQKLITVPNQTNSLYQIDVSKLSSGIYLLLPKGIGSNPLKFIKK